MSAGTGGPSPPPSPSTATSSRRSSTPCSAMRTKAPSSRCGRSWSWRKAPAGDPGGQAQRRSRPLIEATIRQAQLAADLAKPCVFAPPISTFSNPKKAREIDLANGLALSVEIDRDAARARQRLEFLIGPATAVVASGGTGRTRRPARSRTSCIFTGG